MLEIRAAAIGDLTEVQRIARAAYAIYVPRIGREPAPMVADFASQIGDGQVFLAIEAGRAAGFIVCFARPTDYFIENIAVDPISQGKGVGRELMAFAETRAGAMGLTRLELYTNAKMHENLALYPRLGWRETDRRTEDGFDRVYFAKTLPPSDASAV